MTTSATERVRIVAPGQTYVGKQGITYGAGASAETVGAEKICMNVMPMPPGARAKAHYHDGIETIAYMLDGRMFGLLRRRPGAAHGRAHRRAGVLPGRRAARAV